MKTTVYIAGKVTSLPINEVIERFKQAEKHMRKRGFEVFNPVSYVQAMAMENWPWEAIMKVLLPELFRCDAIVCLPDWNQSRGATLERYMASSLHMTIYEYDTDMKMPFVVPEKPEKHRFDTRDRE